MNGIVPDPELGHSAAPSAVVMFGLDPKGKAHASRFTAADAALAERAAGLMGMKVLRLESPEQQETGGQVSLGKIFAGGKALCGFVARALWEKLDADPAAFTPERPAKAEVPPAAARKPKGGHPTRAAAPVAPSTLDATGGPTTPPADRDSIAVGHMVLAAEEDFPEVWYLAEVTALKGPALLLLIWVGEQYATEPPFNRHRDHVALLPLAIAATLK